METTRGRALQRTRKNRAKFNITYTPFDGTSADPLVVEIVEPESVTILRGGGSSLTSIQFVKDLCRGPLFVQKLEYTQVEPDLPYVADAGLASTLERSIPKRYYMNTSYVDELYVNLLFASYADERAFFRVLSEIAYTMKLHIGRIRKRERLVTPNYPYYNHMADISSMVSPDPHAWEVLFGARVRVPALEFVQEAGMPPLLLVDEATRVKLESKKMFGTPENTEVCDGCLVFVPGAVHDGNWRCGRFAWGKVMQVIIGGGGVYVQADSVYELTPQTVLVSGDHILQLEGSELAIIGRQVLDNPRMLKRMLIENVFGHIERRMESCALM